MDTNGAGDAFVGGFLSQLVSSTARRGGPGRATLQLALGARSHSTHSRRWGQLEVGALHSPRRCRPGIIIYAVGLSPRSRELLLQCAPFARPGPPLPPCPARRWRGRRWASACAPGTTPPA